MEVMYEVCCGRDVHKKSVTAGALWASGRRRQTREFGTFRRELLKLSDGLRSCGVTHVALESTGVYGKPVWNLLEGQFEVRLVNAQHIKAASLFVPGGLGCVHEKGQLFISFVSSTGGAEGKETGDDRRGPQSVDPCLLHPAR